ncbi:MAG: glycosyltransferase [Pseudomonadota bacterium]
MSSSAAPDGRLRVLHFVSGGFSGATQVAIDLARAAARRGDAEAVLVLRRKRRMPLDRIAALRAEGLDVRMVPGWAHVATVLALCRLCRDWRPDVLLAHGFSEHLWGRFAGLLARVPVLVHVEHNSRERYTAWRLIQARWLAARTAAIVGCSASVSRRLAELGFPASRIETIPNGIDFRRFQSAASLPYQQRETAIVMVARFSAQKDHLTLIEALALLRAAGLSPALYLAGSGSRRHEAAVRRRVDQLQLQDQVRFLGQHADIPGLLGRTAIAALSTHYEGMPLAVIEAMAAGCAVVATRVSGVVDVIEDGVTGLLCPPRDARALSLALEKLLRHRALAQRLAQAAQDRAMFDHALETQAERYYALYMRLVNERRSPHRLKEGG